MQPKTSTQSARQTKKIVALITALWYNFSEKRTLPPETAGGRHTGGFAGP